MFLEVSPPAIASSSSLPVVDHLSKEPAISDSVLLDLSLCCAVNTQGCIVALRATYPHGQVPRGEPSSTSSLAQVGNNM